MRTTDWRRIGVFGGTFDPPHNGHLYLAGEALRCLYLDGVLWVITPDPPHKLNRSISPLSVRLRMLEAALRNRPEFQISLVDANRPGPQYAVDTLRLLQADHPNAALFYLMGGDSLHDLPTWYQPDEVLRLAVGLGVLRRSDTPLDLDDLERRLPGITAKTTFIPSLPVTISSSQLRKKVRTGQCVDDWLPSEVIEVIRSARLYSGPELPA